MTIFVYFLSGILFALGLGLSGMTQPQNILSFLDLTGEWRPDLLLVMFSAVTTYLIGFRLIVRRPKPLLAHRFTVPSTQSIDSGLVAGSGLFGLGWGLVGFCPGPALVTVVSGADTVLVFLLAMATGMYFHQVLSTRLSEKIATPSGAG